MFRDKLFITGTLQELILWMAAPQQNGKHYTGGFQEWNNKEKLLVSMACIVPRLLKGIV